MNEHLTNLQERTDAKLRYAKVHLNELERIGLPPGEDFDRAHFESFLFHLLGARDAFLQELNAYYTCQFLDSKIRAWKLRKELDSRGKLSTELAEFFDLEVDQNSWLNAAKSMRDHSTHIGGVPTLYRLNGDVIVGDISVSNPKTGKDIPGHFVTVFGDWLSNMRELLERLRASAIAEMNKAQPPAP